MSGIEIIVGVCGAVSALISVFKHGHSLYRDWRAARTSDNLDQSLTIGQRQVQQEYNAYFLRLGARFASGDDIAVSELKDIIILLQSHLIIVLQSSVQSESRGTTGRWFRFGSNRRQGGGTTDTSRLVEVSDNARMDSIRVMTALSQRLEPIPPSVSTPTRSKRPASFFCEGARLLQANRHLRSEAISTPSSQSCKYCNGYLWGLGWTTYIRQPGIVPFWQLSRRFWDKSHTPAFLIPGKENLVRLGCIFCDSVEVFTAPVGLKNHLLEFHKDGSDFSSDFKNDCDISAK